LEGSDMVNGLKRGEERNGIEDGGLGIEGKYNL
jgi:hypothetical protein